MALGAASINLSDMDRGVYGDYSLTIAQHPSETDERMMVRIWAFALNVAGDESQGQLQLAKDLWDADEPALWHKDYTGAILHWIDVGQSDDKHLLRAAGRADKVSVYSFSPSMALQVTVQDGQVWMSTDKHSAELTPMALV